DLSREEDSSSRLPLWTVTIARSTTNASASAMACRWEGVDHAGAIEPCRSGRPGLAEELAQQPERELCGSGPDERRRDRRAQFAPPGRAGVVLHEGGDCRVHPGREGRGVRRPDCVTRVQHHSVWVAG